MDKKYWLAGGMVAIMALALTAPPEPNAAAVNINNQQTQAKAKLAAHKEWAIELVRDNLKDPRSMEVRQAWFGANGNVCISFYAKNSWGAVVPDLVSVEPNGFILQDNPSALQGACGKEPR